MTETHAGHEDPISTLESYINELNELEPSQRRLALAVFLALKVVRVRMFKSSNHRLSAVAESSMPQNEQIKDVCLKLSNAVDFPATLRDILSSLSSTENGEKALAPVASIDLVADESGNVTLNVGQALPLEGEDLATLQGQDAAPLSTFNPSDRRDDRFLSASEAASLLGVAKSTITRKVDKNEVLGFRAFTNALRIPREQFVDGTVVTGISDVLEMFAEETFDGQTYTDHRGAWYFLNTVVYPGNSTPRPIDRLKACMRNRTSHDVIMELTRIKESLDHGDHI